MLPIHSSWKCVRVYLIRATWGTRAVGIVYNLCRVKTDRSAVLTVKSGLDPHMIIKLKDGCKSWILWVFGLGCLLKLKWVGINLHIVTRCC
jgi:hypothetical protein